MTDLPADAERPYVRYIDKTRAYYLSQGYEKPYAWAQQRQRAVHAADQAAGCQHGHADLDQRDRHQRRSALRRQSRDQGAGNVYAVPSDTPAAKLYSRTQSYDRYATSLDDPNAYFPDRSPA